jgi:PAS domain S-box-containing protein
MNQLLAVGPRSDSAELIIRTDLARVTWHQLAPVAFEVGQTVNKLAANAIPSVSPAMAADFDLLLKAGESVLVQLRDTVGALDLEALDEHRLGRLRHDLRTPLNSLKGYCELLLEDCQRRPDLLTGLGEISRLIGEFGKGIDSTMILPQSGQSAELPIEELQSVGASDLGAGLILLVEDHDESRAVVARLLRKDGHIVLEAADGRAALTAMAESNIDVVLLDHHLPDVEGNEILTRMKADPQLAQIPVIMISAGDEARQISTSLKLGADDYIAKPIDPVLLRARLAACLDRKRLRERNNAFWLDSLKTVMDLAIDGIVILTSAGQIEAANPNACAIFGLSIDKLGELPFGPLLGRSNDWTPGEWIAEAGQYVSEPGALREMPAYRHGGAVFPLEISIRGMENTDQPRFVAICRDATARRAEEERMAFLARHDPGTDLPNRTVFIDWIDEALTDPNVSAALILVGISGLRDQTEVISLHQGANVLRTIAQDITRALPKDTRLASLGNDQFGVLVANRRNIAMVEALADQVLSAIPRVVSVDGAEIDIEAWAGVTALPDDGDNPSHLMRNLDLAIVRARRERDRSICVFHRDMMQSYRARRTMERDLAEALDLGQLELYFQPKVRISDFAMVGGEALIRWADGLGGFIPPSQFIPIAETTGLIVPLGQFVIEDTVRRIAGWTASGIKVPTIAVNVSPIQFRRTDLVRIIRDATLARGVACSSLEVEITETLLVQDRLQASRILMQLRTLGTKIAIDDFGTGHSSLSYLAELPIDTLKIDQSFVKRLDHSGRNREIVKTVVQLAESLDMQTIAEGVERLEHAQFLDSIGCIAAQGYYFARPLPADAFARLFGQILPVRA